MSTKNIGESAVLFDNLTIAQKRTLHAILREDSKTSIKRHMKWFLESFEEVLGPGQEEKAKEIYEKMNQKFEAWRDSLIARQ